MIPADSQQVFNYRSDADANKYQGWVPESIEDVVQFINKQPKQFNKPDTWFQLAIIRKDDKKLIGDIGIHFIGPDNQQTEVGCTLDINFQGQGYATEALEGVLGHLFGNLEKHRVFASVDPDNSSSISLLERTGFRKEAHHKQSLFFKGQWVDDVVFAILKSEWTQTRA